MNSLKLRNDYVALLAECDKLEKDIFSLTDKLIKDNTGAFGVDMADIEKQFDKRLKLQNNLFQKRQVLNVLESEIIKSFCEEHKGVVNLED